MDISHQYLDIKCIELDPNNPRIAPDLEAFEDKTDPKLLEMALNPGDAKFIELKQAIVTNGGIINPIIVNHVDGKYVVIEGNTRLTIYSILNRENRDDDRWRVISAFVHENMPQKAIDAVRLQAHLVGVRNWSPFARARYLHYLWEVVKLPPGELVDFCGGDKQKVIRTIHAYKEMNEIYKPLVPEDDFFENQFSIFLEAQTPKIRNTLLAHGFTTTDLAQWVASGKFKPRQELIRKLPEIMKNSRSREIFLARGASEAEMYIDRPDVAAELASASIAELCAAIETVIDKMGLKQRNVAREKVGAIEDGIKALTIFYDQELKQFSEIPMDIEIS